MSSYETQMKPYEELVFSDDFMFGKTMEDLDLCREVIECLLQRPVGELSYQQVQKEFKFTSDGKPIRLDVYSKDYLGNIYNTEMQNRGNKSIRELCLPNRSRYYQSSIDVDFLDKGGHYRTLPDSNVLFICTFDPFELGLPQYTFRERCDEDNNLILNDGTEKHFYNCTYEGNDIPEELRTLYKYIRTGEAVDDLTVKIDSAVENVRKNEVWRTTYMKERILLMDAKEEGREEGREEERRNTAKEKERADKAEARVAELEALLAGK